MSAPFEITQRAAMVYAVSLLQLAQEAGQAEDVGAELAALAELWRREPAFATLMSSAAIDADTRRESLKRTFGGGRVNRLVLNLLLVLNDKGRGFILPALCRAYRKSLDESLRREEVVVTTTLPLDAAQRAAIEKEMRRLTGREPMLVERVDAELLGGMTVQVRDRVFDTSVRRRLRELSRALNQSIDKHLRGQSPRFVTEG
jgi:F-type H+-transporting ATPase subunit delta